jgi:hypothetical protein
MPGAALSGAQPSARPRLAHPVVGREAALASPPERFRPSRDAGRVVGKLGYKKPVRGFSEFKLVYR